MGWLGPKIVISQLSNVAWWSICYPRTNEDRKLHRAQRVAAERWGQTKMNSQNFPNAGDSGSSAPAISEPEFQALIEMVGPEMPEIVVDLLDTYVEESTELVHSIADGMKNGDYDSMLRPAHSLKSSSASIGAMHLSKLCADLEAHLRGSLPELDVPRQVERVSGEFIRVRSALAQERTKLLA